MDLNHGPNSAMVGSGLVIMIGLGPAEDPVRFVAAHVDAAMAHRQAKILMPIGAMEGMSRSRKK